MTREEWDEMGIEEGWDVTAVWLDSRTVECRFTGRVVSVKGNWLELEADPGELCGINLADLQEVRY